MRPVQDLIQLRPEEMTPEEQQYLYETLRNMLITRGALSGPDDLRVSGPIAEILPTMQQAVLARGMGIARPGQTPANPSARERFAGELLKQLSPVGIPGQLLGMAGLVGQEGSRILERATGNFLEGRPLTGASPADTKPAKKEEAPKQPTPAESHPEPAKKMVMTSRVGPDGKVVFANTEVAAADDEAIADAEKMYQRGVAKFRGQSMERQKNLAPLSERTAGIVPPVGGRIGDFKTLPQRGGVLESAAVATPTGAPPGWDKMSPAQRQMWLADQAVVAGVAQPALAVRKEAAEVRDVENPVGAALRVPDEVRRRAEAAAANNPIADVAVAKAKQANPNLTPAEEALIRKKAADDAIAKAEGREEQRIIMTNPVAGSNVLRGGVGLQ